MDATVLELGEASIKDETYFRETIGKITETREWTQAQLARLGFSLKIPRQILSLRRMKAARHRNYLPDSARNISHVRYFNKPRISNHLRITIGTPEEMRKLIEFLEHYLAERKEKEKHNMDSLVQWFTANPTPYISETAVVFIISLPILEFRGGLLAASPAAGTVSDGAASCIIGNILPIPFILLFIKQIFKWMKKTRLFRPMIEWLERKAMGKSDKIEKYEFWGLVLFVGIPLPGTGAWTGALIASLLILILRNHLWRFFLGFSWRL